MGTPIWIGYIGLVESPRSGGWEIGATTKRIGIWEGKLADCEAAAPTKGQFGSGKFAGWLVDRALIQPDKGERGTLTVYYANAIGSGAQLPADTWDIQSFEDNPRIERHSRYSGLSSLDLQNVQTAVQGKDDTTRDTAYNDLPPLGAELVDKIRRGQESYYRPGRRYIWTSHLYFPPFPVDGGYIEVPGGPGAMWLNPNYSWLRLADDLAYENGIYRITSQWLGAPFGHFDSDIY